MKFLQMLCVLACLVLVSQGARAELRDQGLASIMDIIDKAIAELNNAVSVAGVEVDPATLENATNTIVNLSRTLGNLSYSRLQCGEAGVLSEFTIRVQQVPEESRDAMRDAFQEGFDKSKEESPLISADECERLTASRKRREAEVEANVDTPEEKGPAAQESQETVEAKKPDEPEEDPRFRYLRVAELSGQLAYRRRFCEGDGVFNRDYNEYLNTIPEEFREDVKSAYWNGYKHGKRLNKTFSREQCPQT